MASRFRRSRWAMFAPRVSASGSLRLNSAAGSGTAHRFIRFLWQLRLHSCVHSYWLLTRLPEDLRRCLSPGNPRALLMRFDADKVEGNGRISWRPGLRAERAMAGLVAQVGWLFLLPFRALTASLEGSLEPWSRDRGAPWRANLPKTGDYFDR